VESSPKPERPPLRWAGGKFQILPNLLRLVPLESARYFEPMAGGAALFFALTPKKSFIADINADLINFYRALRDRETTLCRELLNIRASKAHYYRLRDTKPRTPLSRAVRFAYLNRLAWNGLYRVNRRGAFNVPIGDRLPTTLWRTADLARAAQALRSATLISKDFENVLALARRDDFAFIDPPYPKGARGSLGFNRYSPHQFGLADHVRLASCVRRLTSRGVKIMLTLAPMEQLQSLYPTSFIRHLVSSRSLISCHGRSRGYVRETILTNYPA
jgi:DNA adenine methylase